MRPHSQTATAFTAITLSLMAIITPAATAITPEEMADLYTRAVYSAEDTIPLGRFEGERETRITPEFKTPAELDRMADDYAARLLDDIKAGRHDLTPDIHEQLLSIYGSTDYNKLQGAPGFRIKLDKYIQEKRHWQRAVVLNHEYTRLHRRESYSIVLDEGGRARIEKNVLHATENEREDEDYNLNNSATTVITNDSSRSKLRSRLPQAFENHGAIADPSVYERWMAGFDPRTAGRAVILSQHRWGLRDLVAAQPAQTPEGKGIRLTFSRTGGGSDDVLLLTVLPERDYLVWEQKEYGDLQLRVSIRYTDYRAISDGRWYPFKRTYLSTKGAAIPAAVRERVNSGAIEAWSDEALAAADAAQPSWTYDDRFTARRIDARPEIEEKEFTLDFEPGTIVYDMRRLDRSGAPIRTIVAEPAAQEPVSIAADQNTPEPPETAEHAQPKVMPAIALSPETPEPQGPAATARTSLPHEHDANEPTSSTPIIAMVIAGALLALVAIVLRSRVA